MKARISSKVYDILKRDRNGLIPREVGHVEVRYDEQGNPRSVHFYPRGLMSVNHHKELNEYKPQTQEERDKMIELLERSLK